MALTEQARADGVFQEDMSVKEIMDTWTLQMGFPVIKATRSYENGTVVLTQERFVLEPLKNTSEATWWIPITYMTATAAPNSTWMKEETEITLNNIDSSSWLLLNVNQTGYYRVNYDLSNWQKLIEILYTDHFVFDAKNRAQMVDDTLNLASAGYLDYEIALNVTKYLINERDYVPWKAAFNAFDFLYDMFIKSGHFDLLKVT